MPKPTAQQRQLFVDLTADEAILANLLQTKASLHVDDLYYQSGLSSSTMASALLMLEMKGVVISLPGKLYQLA